MLLAIAILAGRMRAGSVNTIAGWVRDGSHKLSRWEATLPSMTSASQAGMVVVVVGDVVVGVVVVRVVVVVIRVLGHRRRLDDLRAARPVG